MPKCFVIMSFDENMERVYSPIRDAAANKGYSCDRADSELRSDDVPDTIIKSLIEADVVIADLTNPKPNVYFELGIAYSVCKPTICISQTTDLPFDVRNYRIIKYDLSQQPKLLRLELEEALDHIKSYETNPVMRSGKSYFDLRAKIEENLNNIIKERVRAEEFANFAKTRWSDNTIVAERLIDKMLSKHGFRRKKNLIAVSGAGSIGKSTFSKLLKSRLEERLSNKSIEILPTDAYMMSRAERASRNMTGFDVRSHDLKAFERDVQHLMDGGTVTVRPYDHSTGAHGDEISIHRPDILILEGIHSFHPPIDPLITYPVFIYATKFIVKELKFLADFMFRGYSPETAFEHSEREYMDYEEHVYPFYKQAQDIIYVDGYWRYRLEDAEGKEDAEGEYRVNHQ